MKRFVALCMTTCMLFAISPACIRYLPAELVAGVLHVEEENVPYMGILICATVPLAILTATVLMGAVSCWHWWMH